MAGRDVVNFGRNVRFRPRHSYVPADEPELLEILTAHRRGRIRVVGAGHSWSDAIVSEDALIDMRRFDYVRVTERGGETFVTVGAGCRIKRVLAVLNRRGLTLPSIGLITEQTVAGAISTGTHGSGKHTLSHYPLALRIACYHGAGETAEIREVRDGPELWAARCSLGALGVIVDITLPCVPQYHVRETVTLCNTCDEALALEGDAPLQQFYLIPHLWRIYAQQRIAAGTRPGPTAPLYRLYWLLNLDVGLHLLVKLFAARLQSRRLVRTLFRRILPALTIRGWTITDRSDRALAMEHELFRHLETEVFVPRSRVAAATEFLTEVLQLADGAREAPSHALREAVARVGLERELERLHGQYTHHYPICFRRLLPDDTLLSMSAGTGGEWYAISLITYVEPREPFYAFARFLSTAMARLFEARLHWGKWFPLGADEVRRMYPRLDEFREICDRFDPRGVFRNDYLVRVLGFPGETR